MKNIADLDTIIVEIISIPEQIVGYRKKILCLLLACQNILLIIFVIIANSKIYHGDCSLLSWTDIHHQLKCFKGSDTYGIMISFAKSKVKWKDRVVYIVKLFYNSN